MALVVLAFAQHTPVKQTYWQVIEFFRLHPEYSSHSAQAFPGNCRF
ncbi:hypothetical protein AU15_21170 [Marinobacter salarius]|jgi:hypothetical protein|uniref:Uncharacterized protein n=1 Tax=Marinobacter salarius TaxID=1420917 RepID=W5Z4Q4_9GAMM|nr:hypothetical protein AU15_21170 [Marinobacter salarius]